MKETPSIQTDGGSGVKMEAAVLSDLCTHQKKRASGLANRVQSTTESGVPWGGVESPGPAERILGSYPSAERDDRDGCGRRSLGSWLAKPAG
jgi:hypothetical protein